MPAYPAFVQVVSSESHIAVPEGSLFRRHSYDLRFHTRGPRRWLPDARAPLDSGGKPYVVVFLRSCPVCEKARARCLRCQPHGRAMLVQATAPIVVDPAQKWQPRRCVPRTIREYTTLRNRIYQAERMKKHPRGRKRKDGRGPVRLVRKIRERVVMLQDASLGGTVRVELEAAQLRDLDMLDLALGRRCRQRAQGS